MKRELENLPSPPQNLTKNLLCARKQDRQLRRLRAVQLVSQRRNKIVREVAEESSAENWMHDIFFSVRLYRTCIYFNLSCVMIEHFRKSFKLQDWMIIVVVSLQQELNGMIVQEKIVESKHQKKQIAEVCKRFCSSFKSWLHHM